MWRSCPQEEETDTYTDEIRIDGALLPCAHATFGGDADMSVVSRPSCLLHTALVCAHSIARAASVAPLVTHTAAPPPPAPRPRTVPSAPQERLATGAPSLACWASCYQVLAASVARTCATAGAGVCHPAAHVRDRRCARQVAGVRLKSRPSVLQHAADERRRGALQTRLSPLAQRTSALRRRLTFVWPSGPAHLAVWPQACLPFLRTRSIVIPLPVLQVRGKVRVMVRGLVNFGAPQPPPAPCRHVHMGGMGTGCPPSP